MARIALALLLLAPATAMAHKLNVYAYADGATIAGRVYFAGDIPAQQTDVIARDSSGHEMARTKTDEKGNFTLLANKKTDYQITAETPDGHSASFRLSAAELPDGHRAETGAIASHDTHPLSSTDNVPSPLADQVGALQKQIEAMRIQIDESEHQIRFRDMLGGVGYIFGLAGLAFYFKAKHRPSVPTSPKHN